jgi:hypothetical protein
LRVVELEQAELDVEELIAQCQDQPLRIQSSGKDVAIMLDPKLYDVLVTPTPPNVNPVVAALFRKSLVERHALYKALSDDQG